MEEFVRVWALDGASLLDAVSALIIVVAAIQALVRSALVFGKPHVTANLQSVRVRLSQWLALALELLIGSDIIRTAVSPSWNELGQLAAIVLLRVAINYTLMNDMKEGAPPNNTA